MARTRSIPGVRTLPRQPRSDLAAKWRRHALGPPLGDDRSSPESSSDSTANPERKKPRRDAAAAAAAECDAGCCSSSSSSSSCPHPLPPLPPDLLVLVLGDVASLCPRTAFGCRHVSTLWREAATDARVQAEVWRRCVGEQRPPGGDGDGNESGVADGDGNCDVAEALARVESDIFHGPYRDPPGYPYTDGAPELRWLEERFAEAVTADAEDDANLDDGNAVLMSARRGWWRAAETLVRGCGAVDHRFARPDWGRLPEYHGPHIRRGTGLDAVLDLAVDGGDVGLCRALLRCPQTAVRSKEGSAVSLIARPFFRYGFGHEHHPRGGEFHSVAALQAGRVDLAAMLVSPRCEDGGGGQEPLPLLDALCLGDVPWTSEVQPAVEAAVRGIEALGDMATSLTTHTTHRFHVQLGRDLAEDVRTKISRCRNWLDSLDDREARRELGAALDRCSLPPGRQDDESD